MKLKSILAAAAAAGTLAVTSVAAQAADEQVSAREGSQLVEAEEFGRGGFVVPLLAIIAIIGGILAATGGNDGDLPTSP